MAQERLTTVLHHLRRLADSTAVRTLTDGQLLERFRAAQEEAAFAELVRRHGPLVLGVCRRILRQEQDAEDAFQAAFLVLARKADSVRKGEAVASWLYGVARRVALKARARTARRRDGNGPAGAREPEAPASDLALRELQVILDEELTRLAEKYRAPFVLCCLEGKSRAEAARELGWKEGTVAWRLAEARRRLQHRLTRRGVALSAALCAVALGQTAAAMPGGLTLATVRAALPAIGPVPAPVAALAGEVLAAGGATTFKVTIASVLALGAAAAGVFFIPGGKEGPSSRSAKPQAVRPAPNPPASPRSRRGEELTVLAVSRDGKLLAGAGRNANAVRLWDAATGKELRRFAGHSGPVRAASFSPDASLLATADGASFRLWQIGLGQELFRPDGRSLGAPTALAFTHDGKRLAVGSRDGGFCLWDLGSRRLLFMHQGQTGPVAALAFSPDDRLLAAGSEDGTLLVLSGSTGVAVQRVPGVGKGIRCLAPSPDGKRLAAGCRDGTVRLWDPASGKTLWSADARESVQTIAFSPDGKLLAFETQLGQILLLDVGTGKEVRRLIVSPGRPGWMVFSADGRRIITAGSGPRIRTWDIPTGKEVPAQ